MANLLKFEFLTIPPTYTTLTTPPPTYTTLSSTYMHQNMPYSPLHEEF